MPLKRILPLLLAALLLSGCAGRSHTKREDFLRLRTEWLEREMVSLRAAVRADYGEQVYDYVLRYEGSPLRGVLTVEEPEMLSGVAVELGEGGVTLRYDGVELETGAVLGSLNPVQAFPMLLRCWQSAPVTECWEEERDGVPCLTVEFDLTEAGAEDVSLCRTWFCRDTGEPKAAEFLENGRTVLFIRFSQPETQRSGNS